MPTSHGWNYDSIPIPISRSIFGEMFQVRRLHEYGSMFSPLSTLPTCGDSVYSIKVFVIVRKTFGLVTYYSARPSRETIIKSTININGPQTLAPLAFYLFIYSPPPLLQRRCARMLGVGAAVPPHDGVSQQRVPEPWQPRGLRPVLRLRLPEGVSQQVQRRRLQVQLFVVHLREYIQGI